MKKDKGTIKMVEDTFLRRHAKKILIAGGIVTLGTIGLILKKHDIELSEHLKEILDLKRKHEVARDIAVKCLKREREVALNMIADKEEYINNLNPDIKVNQIVNIPEAKKVIAQMKQHIIEIDIDLGIVQKP